MYSVTVRITFLLDMLADAVTIITAILNTSAL